MARPPTRLARTSLTATLGGVGRLHSIAWEKQIPVRG